jgi:myo-inositol-1(or 4)-monophosphatase
MIQWWPRHKTLARLGLMGSIQPPDRSGIVYSLKAAVRAGGAAAGATLPAAGVAAKEGRGNYVTDADAASERIILELIRAAFPADAILSEESRPDREDLLHLPRLWVVDPLDGTNNFRFGRPYWAVSVGYVEGGEPRAGAVYDPFRDELFFAESGRGASLNGSPIRVGDRKDLAAASVATDNCYDPAGTRRNLELCLRFEPAPWLLVRGSAVLGLCEVACGRTDLYFHTDLKPWDTAAAFLIVAEAGGRVVRLDGTPAGLLTASAVAGNADLVGQCVRLFGTKPSTSIHPNS